MRRDGAGGDRVVLTRKIWKLAAAISDCRDYRTQMTAVYDRRYKK
jgi:hypothetical protein